MKSYAITPERLSEGDTVALLSPSWGGPAVFPRVYEAGVATIEDELGLRVLEFPTTRWSPEQLRDNPGARAQDLVSAFRNPDVAAIIATIGGDDSIRTLPFISRAVVRDNPKIVMGYSDTTSLLLHVRRAGVVSFHGPAVMAGLAQAPSLPPQFLTHLRAVLFEGETVSYSPYPWFVDGYPDWNAADQTPDAIAERKPSSGPRVVQGTGTIVGEILGGCVEVLSLMTGTPFFPTAEEWTDTILAIETSEEVPSPEQVRRTLVNFGLQGIVERLAAIIVGRCRDYPAADRDRLEGYLVDIASEYGRRDLPIVTDLDFGHTDPQHVLPLGVPVELDCNTGRLRLVAPAVY